MLAFHFISQEVRHEQERKGEERTIRRSDRQAASAKMSLPRDWQGNSLASFFDLFNFLCYYIIRRKK